MRTPLTHEHLINNGFKFLTECNHEYYRSNDGRICLSQEANRVGCDWYVHVDNEDMCSIGSLDFQYVEDLNMFFLLCGVEARINC